MDTFRDSLIKKWQELPPPVAAVIAHLTSVAAGALVALALSYVLYRIGLPSKPFIYVAF